MNKASNRVAIFGRDGETAEERTHTMGRSKVRVRGPGLTVETVVVGLDDGGLHFALSSKLCSKVGDSNAVLHLRQ